MRLIHAASLAVLLAVFWLVNSGHYTPLMLGFALFSVLLVVWLAWRMDVIDPEGQPIQLTLRALGYMPWLLKEIYKANIDVIKRVLDPRLPVSPCVTRVRSTQRTDIGRVIFANSITLTPGTVTIEIHGDEFEVHALSREGAEGFDDGVMDAKSTAVEGGS